MGQDEVDMLSEGKTKDMTNDLITKQMRRYVVSFNGYEDAKTINYVVDNMVANDAKFIRDAFKLISPDVKMEQTFTCKNCGHEEVMMVPFGTDFFGLTDDYMEQVYEIFFTLKHYGGWSLFELYNLPIGLRKWWLERTIKEYKEASGRC